MAERVQHRLPDWAEGGLVVADLHGHADLFEPLIALAATERRFILALGDLVDRGPDNAATVRQMLALLKDKKGLFVRGNHDDKLYRTLKGNPTVVDSELRLTLEQLAAASDGRALQEGFRSAYEAAPYLVRIGDTVVVHGGFAPAMLTAKSLPRKLAALALYGEAKKPEDAGGKPIRTYRWFEAVPAGLTVVIGHHPISDATVLVRENAAGGRLIHLDCGAGKGRGLAALRLSRAGLVENACEACRTDGGVAVEAISFAAYSTVAGADEIG